MSSMGHRLITALIVLNVMGLLTCVALIAAAISSPTASPVPKDTKRQQSSYGCAMIQIGGLHCFATGSFALGSKLFSGLAVQTLGICLLGAGLGNCFLVGLAHLSHRRGLTRWRLCKGRSKTHHKRQECCANEGEPFQHDRHPQFADNPKPYP